MLRSQALSALFNENLDSTAHAIFLATLSGHLIGTSATSASIPPSLMKKAAVLSTSTFSHHADNLQSSDAASDDGEILRSHSNNSTMRSDGSARSSLAYGQNDTRGLNDVPQSMGASSTQHSVSTFSSANAAFEAGSRAAYLSVQPLPLLAKIEWNRDQLANEDGEVQGSRLRRIIVDIVINRFIDSDDEDNASAVRSTRRYCALEIVGENLCIGVIGMQRDESVSVHNEVSENDEHGGSNEQEGGSNPGQWALQGVQGTERAKQRQIRLLNVRTEAIADFIREEFQGFSMPSTITL